MARIGTRTHTHLPINNTAEATMCNNCICERYRRRATFKPLPQVEAQKIPKKRKSAPAAIPAVADFEARLHQRLVDMTNKIDTRLLDVEEEIKLAIESQFDPANIRQVIRVEVANGVRKALRDTLREEVQTLLRNVKVSFGKADRA